MVPDPPGTGRRTGAGSRRHRIRIAAGDLAAGPRHRGGASRPGMPCASASPTSRPRDRTCWPRAWRPRLSSNSHWRMETGGSASPISTTPTATGCVSIRSAPIEIRERSGVEIRAVGRRARVNLGTGGDAAGKREQHQDGGKHPTKARQGGGHHRNPRQRMRRRAPRAEPAPAGALVRPTRRRGAALPAHKAWVSMRAIRHRPLKRARHTPGFRFASARRSFRPGFRMPLANS